MTPSIVSVSNVQSNMFLFQFEITSIECFELYHISKSNQISWYGSLMKEQQTLAIFDSCYEQFKKHRFHVWENISGNHSIWIQIIFHRRKIMTQLELRAHSSLFFISLIKFRWMNENKDAAQYQWKHNVCIQIPVHTLYWIKWNVWFGRWFLADFQFNTSSSSI